MKTKSLPKKRPLEFVDTGTRRGRKFRPLAPDRGMFTRDETMGSCSGLKPADFWKEDAV